MLVEFESKIFWLDHEKNQQIDVTSEISISSCAKFKRLYSYALWKQKILSFSQHCIET